MPLKHITRALIRKRSEHNEGIISTLEEISLHQEELCAISEVLGTTCRKLKILYLQNNCIDKMQHLQSGNHAFLEEVTSSTQQFRNAILLNKWQPARLKMTAPLVRRSRAGEKSLTLRATAREYKKIRVGDWQMLRKLINKWQSYDLRQLASIGIQL